MIVNHSENPRVKSTIFIITFSDYLEEEKYDGDSVYESIYEDIPQDTPQVKVTP